MPSLHPTIPHGCHGPHKLHVITPVFNQWRFRSRYELYRDFAKRVEDAGAVLWTVEAAFGDRPFEVTDAGNPQHIQLRTSHELWLKENQINLATQRLPEDWKYMAWIDADIQFARPDWVSETMNLLEHYSLIQMFSTAIDLNPNYEPFHSHNGFVYSYRHNLPRNDGPYGNPEGRSDHHPGYAWAIRRDAFNAVGGLLDVAILGAGDRHMAEACIGNVQASINPDLHQNYTDQLIQWQDRAEKGIQRNIGYMPGLLYHFFHSKKEHRAYGSRGAILTRNEFNPDVDLKRDWQGMWQLTDRNYKLRDEIRDYFRARREDDISHESLDQTLRSGKF